MRDALAVRRGVAPPAGLDAAFVRAVRRPPGGRLAVLVLKQLAEHFGVPAAQISATLFPPRRPPPYAL
jgi:hypothetical protein